MTEIGTKRRKSLGDDTYGRITVAERDDGYFYLRQKREDNEPVDMDADCVAMSRETMVRLHALLGTWLNQQ